MKKVKKIFLLGNDHTNTLGLTQVLGREGYYVVAFVWGNNRGLLRASKYCRELYGGHTPVDCINRIVSYKDNDNDDDGKIPIIAACDDAALSLERNSERLKNYVFEYVSGSYTLEQLTVKELQVKLALLSGFNVPCVFSLNNLNELHGEDIFPILIKPLASYKGTKTDIRICRSKDETRDALATLKVTKDVIIQQYIEHDYEISILGCGLKDGDVVIPCVENKLSLYPKHVGS